MTFGEAVGEVIAFFLAWLIWLWFIWFLISKVGHRGKSRWILFVVMCIPPINEALAPAFAFSFLFLMFCPWPVHKNLREAKKQLEESQKQVEESQLLVEALQQQVGRNLDYIRKANLEMERMRQAIK